MVVRVKLGTPLEQNRKMTRSETFDPHHRPDCVRTVIYDFGSNNGDDLPYYLKKADLVVAVEANPVLCAQITTRFAHEIACGILVVVNSVLTTSDDDGDVPFFIHRTNHVLSQFPKPSDPTEFERVMLPARSVERLIAMHGAPHYVKIDIERYDEQILRALFAHNIRPPYISAESHDIGVFASLLVLGGYTAFKLVDGASVPRLYGRQRIRTRSGIEEYAFPTDSSGPFGEDIPTEWMTPNNFFQLLAQEGLGWKDVHATTEAEASATALPPFLPHATRQLKAHAVQAIKAALPQPVLQALKAARRRLT